MYQTTRPLQTTGSSPGPARMSSYFVGEVSLVARLAHVGEAQQGDHARGAADRGLGGVLSHEVGYRGVEKLGELLKPVHSRLRFARLPRSNGGFGDLRVESVSNVLLVPITRLTQGFYSVCETHGPSFG